jgi:hypothetical protein
MRLPLPVNKFTDVFAATVFGVAIFVFLLPRVVLGAATLIGLFAMVLVFFGLIN